MRLHERAWTHKAHPIVLCASALIGLAACSKTPTPAAAKTTTAPQSDYGQSAQVSKSGKERPEEPAIDPKATAALDRMGAFLRAQKEFVVKADTTTDEVLENGQKLQYTQKVEMFVKRPNKVRAKMVSDRKERELYYDGKNMTVYGPRNDYYSTVDAPDTIEKVVNVGERKYGLELPLADMFYWGTDKSGVDAIKGAIDTGPATVDGVKTDSYAFRQDDVDWQIWIEQGARPLPRKYVIVTKSEPSKPQFESTLTWTLKPGLKDAMFTFVAPKTAHKIPIVEMPGNDVDSPKK
ncbi:MAG: DUF2092 domain-containing protein [Polyangiaceae bacterium]|nr:DUF2092 domain-containing protein [Polyangiaceae bacterium]